MPLNDLAGQRFGRLTVIEHAGTWKRRSHWKCRCDCATETVVQGGHLKSGNTKSCGCYHADLARERRRLLNEARATHGMSRSPAWWSWRGMVARCNVPVTHGLEHFGCAGVKVDPRWIGPGGFVRFLADVGERPEGTGLGHIGDEGDYIPGNVAWQTKEEQLAERAAKRAPRGDAP